MPESSLRCAVVGLGMGTLHVQGYNAHPVAKVCAVVDTDPAKISKARQSGVLDSTVTAYSDINEMLKKEKPDVVSIATPNFLHKSMTLTALKHGAHVLCEKPLAMCVQDARTMVTAARTAGRRLMINLSYRFDPSAMALKKAIRSGKLGDIYFARTVWQRFRGIPGFGGWFGRNDLSGGGPLIDLGVHRIDLAMWMMDCRKPVEVMGSTWNHLGKAMAGKKKKTYDVEDLAAVMIRFENRVTIEGELAWALNQPRQNRMETWLYGTKAGALHRDKDENDAYTFESMLFIPERNEKSCKTVILKPAGEKSPYYHFVDSILKNRPHQAPGEDGVVIQQILQSLYKSAARGRAVRIA